MTDLTRRPLDDDALGMALRDLATHIDWPAGETVPDLATRVRVAVAARPAATRRPWWRPAGRGLAIALIALLAFAAIAGAVALGLPGLRLVLGDPGATPPVPSSGVVPGTPASAGAPSAGRPGAALGMGRATDLEAARAAVGRPILVPSDAGLGPPDAVYVDAARANAVAMVWAADAGLPATLDPDIGMVLMSFDGSLPREYYMKIIGSDSVATPVTIGDDPGFWIEGDPHIFFFQNETGDFVDDPRRWVGDALIWSDGTTTYRLESSLGRERATEIADGLR